MRIFSRTSTVLNIAAVLQRIGNLGYLGLLSLVSEELAGFAHCGWFLLAFVVAWALRYWVRLATAQSREATEHSRKAEQQFLRNYGICEILAMFNPFLQCQAFQQLAGSKRSGADVFDVNALSQQMKYRLPFKERWRVYNGGVTKETSHSWDIITQRFAYDFIVQDAEGRSYSGEGRRLQDYYCFDREVFAPADGIVCEIRDGALDFPYPGKGWINVLTRDIRGNFVLIKHGPSEYSLLAHLKKGSVLPRVGDRIRAGELVGRCGNSGMSTEPHLHFHVQDGPSFYSSAGLPIRFVNYVEIRDGQRLERESGFLERGSDCEPGLAG